MQEVIHINYPTTAKQTAMSIDELCNVSIAHPDGEAKSVSEGSNTAAAMSL